MLNRFLMKVPGTIGFRPRLLHGPGRHRVEAEGLNLPVWSKPALGEGEKSELPAVRRLVEEDW
jgi:hypothetical protein